MDKDIGEARLASRREALTARARRWLPWHLMRPPPSAASPAPLERKKSASVGSMSMGRGAAAVATRGEDSRC